jgi:cytochrome c553
MPRSLFRAAFLLVIFGASFSAFDAALGRRIYQDGILPSGQLLRAVIQNDVRAEGNRVSCATCHRRSGMGSREGGTRVPPITGTALSQPAYISRADLSAQLFEENQPIPLRAGIRALSVRPGYSDTTLARALRHGIDPAGRVLSPSMPRFVLSNQDLAHLAAYLRTLSFSRVPGVEPAAIHFATVVTEGVDARQRDAMLAVIRTYSRRKNEQARFEVQKHGQVSWDRQERYEAFREWKFEIWELKGSKETWTSQLAALYRRQPVFALIAGMASGSWQPIADFCERTGVPGIFPETLLPDTSGAHHFVMYFNRGLVGEAEALAAYLGAGRSNPEFHRIVQVYRQTDIGSTPADAFRAAFRHNSTQLLNHPVPGEQSLTAAFWAGLFKEERPSVLVLWLQDADGISFQIGAAQRQRPAVYFSYNLIQQPASLKNSSATLRFTYPFALPWSYAPEATHVRGWLGSVGIADRRHERVQLDTYWTLSLLGHSLARISTHLSAEYLLETIEQEVETAPNPGVFPHLSLGPEQRYASKGCYIGKPSGNSLKAISDWIVP